MKLELETFAAVAFLLVTFCGLAAIISATVNDCDDRHGVLVRGVFWYECVQPPGRP